MLEGNIDKINDIGKLRHQLKELIICLLLGLIVGFFFAFWCCMNTWETQTPTSSIISFCG